MALDALVDSTQLDTDLTSVANAIRTKGGTSAQLAFPTGFVDAIEDIETGGGGDYVAADWLDVTKPVGEIVSDVSGDLGFFTFYNRKGITKLEIPNVTKIAPNFCQFCTALKEVIAPNLVNVGNWAFASTTGLTNPVYLPKAILSQSMFNGSRVPIVVFYRIANSNSSTFQSDTALVAVDQNSGYAWNGAQVFSGCTALKTVILRANSVVALGNVNSFTNTPFASGKSGGTLYVPSAQIANYQAATNWSTILGYGSGAQNQILPIEGSIYETQYADGTPIPAE